MSPKIANCSVDSVPPTQVHLDTTANASTRARLTTLGRNGMMDVNMNVSVRMETQANTNVATGMIVLQYINLLTSLGYICPLL